MDFKRGNDFFSRKYTPLLKYLGVVLFFKIFLTGPNSCSTVQKLEDCDDDTSNRMDDCDDIKIEMEENTVPVDPAEILKHNTKKEQGMFEEKSGN